MRMLALRLAAGLVLTATAVSAHPRLVSATPPPGSAAPAPREIRIKFNEPVYPKLSRIELKDQAGAVVKTGTASGDPRDKSVLTAPIVAALAPGRYVVTWRAVSSDTHRVSGTFDFTVK